MCDSPSEVPPFLSSLDEVLLLSFAQVRRVETAGNPPERGRHLETEAHDSMVADIGNHTRNGYSLITRQEVTGNSGLRWSSSSACTDDVVNVMGHQTVSFTTALRYVSVPFRKLSLPPRARESVTRSYHKPHLLNKYTCNAYRSARNDSQ